MINCMNCYSKDIEFSFNQNGIQENYRCRACGLEYTVHEGMRVVDHGSEDVMDFGKIYDRTVYELQK